MSLRSRAAVAGSHSRQREKRLALVLGNGAYKYRAPLSKTVPTAVELRRKLEGMGFEVVAAEDQSLSGMRETTLSWLRLLEQAADEAEELHRQDGAPSSLLLLFAFCGHGRAQQFLGVDCPKGPPPDSYCFFEDLVWRVYQLCSESSGRRDWSTYPWRPNAESFLQRDRLEWRPISVRFIAIVESCRRLHADEKEAYEKERQRISNGKRHLLPSLAAFRPDLAPMGGAEWDAARLGFLSQLGPGSPELLLALSSESTTPSYDVVFLRSVTEMLDRPVRLGGILERASLDTLRRTGHKQKPVILSLHHDSGSRFAHLERQALQDVVLAPGGSRPQGLSRSSSCEAVSSLVRPSGPLAAMVSTARPADEIDAAVASSVAADNISTTRAQRLFPRSTTPQRRSGSLPPSPNHASSVGIPRPLPTRAYPPQPPARGVPMGSSGSRPPLLLSKR
eukprot:TRINITY_DN22996_c0_g1_i1.p1 TRINITY_DN22996_c0_g1~~TRINITY_DN22996_c0_g1_i1.p1  ORF type:complete len:449 (+),score=52.53 TRINITY_DN22996_c0_g1_i1:1126-2472(+)